MSSLDAAFLEFVAEGEEIIQRVTNELNGASGSTLSHINIDSLYRDVHTLKGSAQLFGFAGIGTIAHALEASLEPVRQKRISLDPYFVDLIFECLDLIGRILKNPSLDLEKKASLQEEMGLCLPRLVEMATSKFELGSSIKHEGVPRDEAMIMNLLAPEVTSVVSAPGTTTLEKVEAPLVAIPEEQLPPAPQPHRNNKMEKSPEEHGSEANSIRVQVNLLDKLMNLVGEMVLTRNQVLQYARLSDDNEFLKLTQRLDLVTSELQDNVMRTRMQPIGSVFSKFQRMVRDLSRDLGKNIELHLHGAETELDKSLIEAIKDPLTHIVRNACDHGIELPKTRLASGKSEHGKLTIHAYHEGGQIIIEINDDGGGLDPAKIKEKAIQKGILSVEKVATFTDKQCQEIIFMPGFTTAEEVSSVSGRGVGMDVVRTNIEKVGGQVELESVVKKFTRIRLKIPLTLAIVPAMIVSCGGETYAIPQVKLQELLRVDLEEDRKIEMLQGQAVYRLRNQLLPLISFKKLMTGTDDEIQSVQNIVVLNSASHTYGLVVDEIRDTADIVVKPLPSFLKKADIFSGATIMGDGGVALIVDTQGVADRALGVKKDNQNKVDLKSESEATNLSQTTTEYLEVRIAETVYAIPLVLVHRLEEFKQSTVEHSGEEYLVKYRDGLLPLLDVQKLLRLEARKNNSETPKSSELSVVVISKNNRYYGFLVDEILDITQTNAEIISHIRPKDGLLGTVIAQSEDVLTIIDAYAIINMATGVTTDTKKKVHKKGKVLLAEDTIFFVKQITRVLNEAGLEVTHALDGEAALAELEIRSPQYFSLIVSDIEMPKMNGFEFATNVRKDSKYKHIPLIALTTRFKEIDQQKGLDCGFDRYLEKLQSDDLIDTINSLLGAKK